MPMVQLTTPVGALTQQGRGRVQRELAAIVLKWEGAPDTEFFRAQTWTQLTEVPQGTLLTAADDKPRFRVDVTIPAGVVSDRRKARLVAEVTETVLRAAGLDSGESWRVWVLVHEQAEATWGVGGGVVRFAELVGRGDSAGADA